MGETRNMETAKRIYRNTMYLTIADIISKVLQFVVMMYAARILSKEHFGQFSFALSFSFLVAILADIGLNMLFIREVSRKKDSVGKHFVHTLAIKAVLSLVVFLLTFSFALAMDYSIHMRLILLIVSAFTILSSITGLFYSIFRAFEMMHYDSLVKVSRMLILTFMALYVLFNDMGILAFCISFLVVEVMVVFLGFTIAYRKFLYKSIRFTIDWVFLRRLLNETAPFGVAFLFGSIYFWSGTVLLSLYWGDVVVATFSTAYNLALGLLFIPTVYTNAIYPVLSRYFVSSPKDLLDLYSRSWKYLLLITLPLALWLFSFSGEIIGILYGEKYADSSMVLAGLSFFVFFKFLNFLQGIMLSAINKQKNRMKGQGIAALVNIVLNMILIPWLSIIGLIISSVLTELVLFASYYFYVGKGVKNFYPKKLGIILLPMVALAGIWQVIPFNFYISSAIGVVMILLAILVLPILDKNDKAFLEQVLPIKLPNITFFGRTN